MCKQSAGKYGHGLWLDGVELWLDYPFRKRIGYERGHHHGDGYLGRGRDHGL
jgi:hypothetical protein